MIEFENIYIFFLHHLIYKTCGITRLINFYDKSLRFQPPTFRAISFNIFSRRFANFLLLVVSRIPINYVTNAVNGRYQSQERYNVIELNPDSPRRRSVEMPVSSPASANISVPAFLINAINRY